MNTIKSISVRHQFLAKWGGVLLVAPLCAFPILNRLHHRLPIEDPGRSSAVAVRGSGQQAMVPEARPRLPLSFEVNQGQADPRARFLARTPDYTLFLTPREAVFVLGGAHRQKANDMPSLSGLSNTRRAHTASVVRLSLVRASPTARVIGSEELIGRVNYFIGKDPTGWHANIPTYGKVTYHNVYAGVDLAYHDKFGQLESDLIVSPGANPAKILLRFEGADRVTLAPSGDLLAVTKSGRLCLRRPVAYQGEKDDKRTVLASYVVWGDREIGFRVDPFDRSQALVIDPEITYLPDGQDVQQVTTAPGFGTTEDAAAVTPQFVDSSGNVYVAGATDEVSFPTSVGAYETTYPQGTYQTGIICKLNSTLSSLIYSTFLGVSQSSGTVTMGGPLVDSSGNVYVAGSTNEVDFPTTSGAYETTYPSGNTQAGFIAKLNSTLSTLTYSTFLGAAQSSGTVTVGGFKVDSSGNVYVVGATSDYYFPTTAGAYEPTYPGGTSQGFITKLNSTLSALIYSTFLGAAETGGYVTVGGPFIDSSGNVYVVGGTNEAYFPTTSGAYEPTYPGGNSPAGFITKLNSTLSALIYSTFLGVPETGGTVTIGGFKVNSSGDVYVAGSTNEPDFPTTAGAYETAYPGGDSPAGFITELNPTLSALVSSTFLGATQPSGGGVVNVGGPFVDSSGNVYVVGTTNLVNFPTTSGAYETTFLAGQNQTGFITKLNPTLSALVYSTFLGAYTAAGDGFVILH